MSVIKIPLTEIRGKIQMYPENWINMKETNCYAYALGLDIKESDICKNAYQPGTISETVNLRQYESFPYEVLISGLENDLDVLGINYRLIKPDEKIELNEWKIVLMVKKYCDGLDNFHFLRQDIDGIWSHKVGYQHRISRKDSLGCIISNPIESHFFFYTYDKCYALRLNKKFK